MLQKPLILLIIAVCFVLPLTGQSRYHFSTLDIGQGLSNSFVWSLGQDKYGFMWIGTVNGLNRYDGHRIKQYFNDPKDSFSIPGNAVYWIQKDEDGDMWFACGHNGMARYNYEKDRFEKLPEYEAARKATKYHSPVWRIFNDGHKGIYLACGANLFRYTKAGKKWEDLTPLFNGGIEDAGIGLLLPQGKEKLWVLTDAGLFLYNLAEKKITPVPFDKDKMGYGLAAMHDGEFINDDEMIISMGRPGFVLFNTRTWQFRPAPAPFDPAISKKYNSTGGIIKDSKGRIWLANSSYGLVEYFPLTNTTYSVKNEPSYPYPYLEQEGNGLNNFEDRDGNIWYGTSRRGVVWFQPQQDFVKVYQRNYADAASLADDVVHGVLPAADGNMFVATGKGLSKLNTATGRFINFPHSVMNSEKFPATTVRSFTAHNDTLIMCTDLGLSFYDQKKAVFNRYVAEDEDHLKPFELFTNNLAEAFYTAPGQLILRSLSGMFARFEIKTGKCFYQSNTKDNDTLYALTGATSTVYDARQHILWTEAGKGELYAYNTSSKKITRHYFNNDSSIQTITAMAPGKNGMLWLATNAGAFLYDPATKKSRSFILPGISQEVFNIATADFETVWMSTSNEIIRLKLSTGDMQLFNLNTLVPYIALYKRSLFVDEKNNAWAGSNKGFCIINNSSFNPGKFITAPHLTNVNVFGKQKTFDQPYYDLDKVELNYDENFFGFEFSAFDFFQKDGKKYSYRLEPFDKDWKLSDDNTASYTNVPPGTYKLLLRTQAGPGKWTETKPVIVHIQPPFWKTWWFVLITVLLILYIFYLLFRYRQKMRTEKQIDETINYFANSVYGENSVNEICWDIARNCIAQLQFEDCVVYLLDEKTNRLVQKAAYGPKNPKGHEIIDPIEIEPGKGIVGTVAATGKALKIDDTSKDDRYIVDDKRRYSEMAVPVLHNNKVIGVIDSEHHDKSFFSNEHLKAVSTIASISANKIAEAIAEAQAKENEIKLLEINKMLAESQLMALRAQMNPHFVFNCLNSIQECIVTEKYGEASKYLNKFSKLFRMVLNNSGKNLVTIDEEKEVLELYLELEQMRFEKSFNYRFEIDEDLETEEILIPSMLLQPYVENALWHGLMHKDGERNLHIIFEKVDDDVFRCIIDDDGIGRKRSFELKAQQSKSKRHESKGLKISEDRINVLKRQGYTASLQMTDKYDAAQNAAGTRILIELSNSLKN